MADMFPVMTKGGYDFWECLSAMQKSIRRGLEKEALFWLFEIETCGRVHAAFNRLDVAGQEDVGLADMQAVLFARESVEFARKSYKAKNISWRLGAANAVLALSRAKKSREGDHFQAAVQGLSLAAIEMPDWALDKHTRKGKLKSRGVQFFLDTEEQWPSEYLAGAKAFWLSEEKRGR